MTLKLWWAVGAALVLMVGCGGGGDDVGDGEKRPGSTAVSDAKTAPSVEQTAPAKLDHPGTKAGAKALLERFLVSDPGQRTTLTVALRPSTADFERVFVGAAAKQAEGAYAQAWDSRAIKIGGKAGQTELLLWAATSAQLQAHTGDATFFPGGYKQVAAQLKPGLTFYRFKFVQPGQRVGMAYDGLVYVNGHWVIFPKPWRALATHKGSR